MYAVLRLLVLGRRRISSVLYEPLLGSKKSKVHRYTNESHCTALPRSSPPTSWEKWLPVLLVDMSKKSECVCRELRRDIVTSWIGWLPLANWCRSIEFVLERYQQACQEATMQ